MKANKLLIRRYRSFDREVAVPLRNLTVLTGPNNLGKSTVLLALQLYFETVRGVAQAMLPRRYDYEEDYPRQYVGRPGRRQPTRLAIEFELDENDQHAVEGMAGGKCPAAISLYVEYPIKGRRPTLTTSPQLTEAAVRALCVRIADTVRYVYIPANRGSGFEARRSGPTRLGVLSELSTLALARVKNRRQRLQTIQKLVDDAESQMKWLKKDLIKELQRFLPDIKALDVEFSAPDIAELVRVADVTIDDGARTSISLKGDGVKSLFSIALLQYVARQAPGGQLLFGIEEPEAHLHSNAIYKIKPELRALAQQHIVLLTTHSPILIQRDDIGANLIVAQSESGDWCSTVRPARSLAEIRTCLGIKPQDNMTTAEVVVVVEGDTEVAACGALLGHYSPELKDAVSSGRVRLLAANGASKVGAVVRALARDAANCLVLLDNDDEGRKAFNDLLGSGLIAPADVFMVPDRDGCGETEFEDAFPVEAYLEEVTKAVGIIASVEEFAEARRRSGTKRTRIAKWSAVTDRLLRSRGKKFEDHRVAIRRAFGEAIAACEPALDLKDYAFLRDIAGRCQTLMKQRGSTVGRDSYRSRGCVEIVCIKPSRADAAIAARAITDRAEEGLGGG